MIGLQQLPKFIYSSLEVQLSRGESFPGGPVPGGNQSIAYAMGGQAAVATWNSAGITEYEVAFNRVSDAQKQELDTFFSSAQVNYMANSFTYIPNANRPSTSYTMRLTDPAGYLALEAKSGQGRRLWNISISMRVEVA